VCDLGGPGLETGDDHGSWKKVKTKGPENAGIALRGDLDWAETTYCTRAVSRARKKPGRRSKKESGKCWDGWENQTLNGKIRNFDWILKVFEWRSSLR